MKIKHFIITRFFSQNFEKTNEELFSEKFLSNGFKLVKKNFIKTLENQTNKNFEVIIMIHNDIDIDKIKPLYDIESSFKISIIRKKDIDKYISEFYDICDFIITTRLDYDDFVYKTCVDDVQKKVCDDFNICLYGLNNGCTVIEGETECHLFQRHYIKSGYGFFSTFTSVIINTKDIKKPLNIYDFGEHSNICKNFISTCKNFGIICDDKKIKIFKDNDEFVKYIWFRHKLSQSYLTKKELHSTNIIVDVNLEEDFGYKL